MAETKLKKLVKKGVSKLKDAAVGAVTDKIKDASKSKDSKRTRAQRKALKTPDADITVKKTIKLKDRKKNKQKKKIAKWEKEKKQAAAGSAQSAFLALDAKYKKKK